MLEFLNLYPIGPRRDKPCKLNSIPACTVSRRNKLFCIKYRSHYLMIHICIQWLQSCNCIILCKMRDHCHYSRPWSQKKQPQSSFFWQGCLSHTTLFCATIFTEKYFGPTRPNLISFLLASVVHDNFVPNRALILRICRSVNPKKRCVTVEEHWLHRWITVKKQIREGDNRRGWVMRMSGIREVDEKGNA